MVAPLIGTTIPLGSRPSTAGSRKDSRPSTASQRQFENTAAATSPSNTDSRGESSPEMMRVWSAVAATMEPGARSLWSPAPVVDEDFHATRWRPKSSKEGSKLFRMSHGSLPPRHHLAGGQSGQAVGFSIPATHLDPMLNSNQLTLRLATASSTGRLLVAQDSSGGFGPSPPPHEQRRVPQQRISVPSGRPSTSSASTREAAPTQPGLPRPATSASLVRVSVTGSASAPVLPTATGQATDERREAPATALRRSEAAAWQAAAPTLTASAPPPPKPSPAPMQPAHVPVAAPHVPVPRRKHAALARAEDDASPSKDASMEIIISSSSGGRRLEGYDTGALRGYDVLEGVLGTTLATAPTAARVVSSTPSCTVCTADEVTHRGAAIEGTPDTAPVTAARTGNHSDEEVGDRHGARHDDDRHGAGHAAVPIRPVPISIHLDPSRSAHLWSLARRCSRRCARRPCRYLRMAPQPRLGKSRGRRSRGLPRPRPRRRPSCTSSAAPSRTAPSRAAPPLSLRRATRAPSRASPAQFGAPSRALPPSRHSLMGRRPRRRPRPRPRRLQRRQTRRHWPRRSRATRRLASVA